LFHFGKQTCDLWAAVNILFVNLRFNGVCKVKKRSGTVVPPALYAAALCQVIGVSRRNGYQERLMVKSLRKRNKEGENGDAQKRVCVCRANRAT
jgi:hypothetical protein